MPEELSAEQIEEQKLRDEVQQEVFNEEKLAITLDHKEDPEGLNLEDLKPIEESLEEDPLAGLPPALLEQLSGINERLGALSTIENRLKQTESRIGSMQNTAHKKKLAAEKAEKEKPTEEELAAALKIDEDWEKFEKEFPDMATAISGKQAADTKEIGALREKLEVLESAKPSEEAAPKNIESRLVGIMHPDWQEVRVSEKFQTWIKAQPDEIKQKYTSPVADDAIYVLNEFKKPASSGKTPQEIAVAKQKRLASSVDKTHNHKIKRPKAVADMNEAELRADVEMEVFG